MQVPPWQRFSSPPTPLIFLYSSRFTYVLWTLLTCSLVRATILVKGHIFLSILCHGFLYLGARSVHHKWWIHKSLCNWTFSLWVLVKAFSFSKRNLFPPCYKLLATSTFWLDLSPGKALTHSPPLTISQQLHLDLCTLGKHSKATFLPAVIHCYTIARSVCNTLVLGTLGV